MNIIKKNVIVKSSSLSFDHDDLYSRFMTIFSFIYIFIMVNCIHKNNTRLQPIIKFDFLHFIKKNCHQFGKSYYLLEI